MVFDVWKVNQGAILEPSAEPYRWVIAETLELSIRAMMTSADNYILFERQLFACYWALVET